MSIEQKNKTFISSFMAIGGATLINMLLGLLTTPIITRLVNPEEYGKLSIFTMYTGIALMILCVGLDQALVRFFYERQEMNEKKALISFCFFLPLGISAIASLGIMALSFAFNNLFEFDQLIIFFLCINIIVSIWNRFALLLLRLTYKSKKYAISNIVHKVVYIALAVALLLFIDDYDLLILVGATVGSLIVSSIIATIQTKEYWSIKKRGVAVDKKALLKYGLPFILSMGITSIFQASDKIALNYFCTYEDVGIYASALNLVNIFAIIQTTFNTIWAPMMIEILTKTPENKASIQKVNKYITVIMFGLGACLIFAKDIFALLLGAEYREAAYILPFLIFNPIMYTISETTQPGIEYSKKSYLNIIVALVPCIANIVGNYFLVPIWGCKGAAISTGLAYILFFLMRTIISNRFYYVNYKLWKFAIVTLVTILYAGYNTFHAFGWGSAISFVIVIAVLFALYFKDILDLFKTLVTQVKSIFKKRAEN